jgi:hypothetical protein
MWFRHLALRTEETYLQWIRRLFACIGKRHRHELGAVESARRMREDRVSQHGSGGEPIRIIGHTVRRTAAGLGNPAYKR